MAGGASFLRIGSGEGLSELVMEFPAVLRAFLRKSVLRVIFTERLSKLHLVFVQLAVTTRRSATCRLACPPERFFVNFCFGFAFGFGIETWQTSLVKLQWSPLHKKQRTNIFKTSEDTVVAKIATELIRFDPKVCICKRNSLEFKGETVSLTRHFLPKFPTDLSL